MFCSGSGVKGAVVFGSFVTAGLTGVAAVSSASAIANISRDGPSFNNYNFPTESQIANQNLQSYTKNRGSYKGLQINHVIAQEAYANTVFADISPCDQPAVIMRQEDHQKLLEVIDEWYQGEQRKHLIEGNFYMALNVEILYFFQAGLLKAYSKDLTRILKLLSSKDIRNAPARLLNTEQYKKLKQLINEMKEQTPDGRKMEQINEVAYSKDLKDLKEKKLNNWDD